VCASEGKDLCAKDFKFFAIYDDNGLSKHQDGVIGFAPRQTQKKNENEGISFIDALKKQGKIDRAVFGLFVSRYPDKPHSVQIGDWDSSFVDQGDHGLEWFSITVDNLGYKWQTDLTNAHFGSTKLFQHDFKWIELNAGYEGIGLASEDFEKASQLL